SIISMAKGGARPGAGRPAGSGTLRDALTPEQVAKLVKTAVGKAEAGDSLLLKFILEQVYGQSAAAANRLQRQPNSLGWRGDHRPQEISMEPVKVGFEVDETHLPLWEVQDWRYAFLMGGRGN